MSNKKFRLQFDVDEELINKWNDFLNNNKLVFGTGVNLFRYMLNNIEVLTEQNENLISKNKAETNRLENENVELKKELYKLQNEKLNSKNDLLEESLKEIKTDLAILEVLTSTQMVSTGEVYRMQESKKSSLYLEAKQKVDNEYISEERLKLRRPF